MAFRSGIGAQLMIGQETTWGTRVVPDHTYEFDSENINNSIARIDSVGLRLNQRSVRSDRWAPGKKSISGDIIHDVITKGHGLVFKNMLGAAAVTADGAGWKQTFTPGDPYGLGATIQIGRPDTGGVVRVFEYTGCKVASWELSNSTDTNLKCKTTWDGQAETTNQTLASPVYPASAAVYSFFQGSITVGGAGTYNIHDWTVTNTVGIKTDRYFIAGSGGTKKEQIANALMTPGGTLSAEFTDLTGYTLFTAGTLADIVLTYDTGVTYGTATTYRCVITLKNARFDGDTPNVGGPDVLDWTGNYVLLDDGVNPIIKVEYYSTDAAP